MQLNWSFIVLLMLIVFCFISSAISHKYLLRMSAELYKKLPKDIPYHTVEWEPKMIESYKKYCGKTENLRRMYFWRRASFFAFGLSMICLLLRPFG